MYDGLWTRQLPLYGLRQSGLAAFADNLWDRHADGAGALAVVSIKENAAQLMKLVGFCYLNAHPKSFHCERKITSCGSICIY